MKLVGGTKIPLLNLISHFSRLMTKQTKWFVCPAKTQISLGIRVFTVRMKKAWFLTYPLSAQQRLIRLGGCPGWSESLLSAKVILLVLSCGGSFGKLICNYALNKFVHSVYQIPLEHDSDTADSERPSLKKTYKTMKTCCFNEHFVVAFHKPTYCLVKYTPFPSVSLSYTQHAQTRMHAQTHAHT